MRSVLRTALRLAAAAPLATLLSASGSLAAPLSEEPSRLVYQTYVRAFYDGSPTPDTQGDLAGLEAKVDYLQDLGVGALLLMPVFHSTGDMGYIPRDYFRLDPHYGTADDFRRFVDTMHAHGIKVILDAPVNHISYDSEWFVRGSQRRCQPGDPAHDPSDPDNRYCDFFYFVADPCGTAPYRHWHKPWQWDRTDCNAVWFRHPGHDPRTHRSEKHYATFFSVMPDLKFWDFERSRWNEPVVGEVQRFFDAWAAAGVDGFRIDAAKHFVEGLRSNADPQEPRNKELLQKFLDGVRRVNPDVSFVGEIWSGHGEFEPYLPRSLDIVLDFPFMEAARASVGGNHGERLKGVLKHFEARQDAVKPGHRMVFSGNHDVTRLMSEWNDDAEKWRLAHFLTFTTPFTPLLYYGEEIGMHGRVKRPDATSDDEWVRTINAFPWENDATAGFPGLEPPVAGLPDNIAARNLPAARQDPRSALNLVRELMRIRRDFGVTNATRIAVRDDLFGHVIGWTMREGERCLTVLVNFDRANTYTIDTRHAPAAGYRTGARAEVYADNAVRQGGGDLVRYELKPYAKVIFGN